MTNAVTRNKRFLVALVIMALIGTFGKEILNVVFSWWNLAGVITTSVVLGLCLKYQTSDCPSLDPDQEN